MLPMQQEFRRYLSFVAIAIGNHRSHVRVIPISSKFYRRNRSGVLRIPIRNFIDPFELSSGIFSSCRANTLQPKFRLLFCVTLNQKPTDICRIPGRRRIPGGGIRFIRSLSRLDRFGVVFHTDKKTPILIY